MQLSQLIRNDEAVSPVIGVILVVAITVILASVVDVFTFGLGGIASTDSPEVDWSYDFSGSDVTITHEHGESIEATRVEVQGATGGNWGGVARITPGVSYTGTIDGSADEVRVVWRAPDGEMSTVIGRVAVPN